MNSYERMVNRMKGKPVDKIPNFNIYMTYAARFINKPLSEYYLDYRTLVNANMAMVENFHVDIVQAISDPYREAHDFGAIIDFPENGLPVSKIPLLDSPEKIKSLIQPNPVTGERMLDRLQAIRLMKAKVDGEIPIMGWVEGALAEAGVLRGISTIMMDIYERPDWVKELLEIVTDVAIEFAKAQIEAGANIIGLGDAIASQVSPEMYIDFALPYEKRIFEAVHEFEGIARLHICGDTSSIVPYMTNSGADIIDLDWMVSMREACERYGEKVIFCGNMDPVNVFLNGTDEEVYLATKECLEEGGDNTISAGGCEIPIATPENNLIAQNKALLDFV